MPLSKAIPIPFQMCSATRVQIALEDLREVARAWAYNHNYRKQEGAFQGLPSFLWNKIVFMNQQNTDKRSQFIGVLLR